MLKRPTKPCPLSDITASRGNQQSTPSSAKRPLRHSPQPQPPRDETAELMDACARLRSMCFSPQPDQTDSDDSEFAELERRIKEPMHPPRPEAMDALFLRRTEEAKMSTRKFLLDAEPRNIRAI